MSANIRRVRTVRLSAPDDALVRRGAILLEDALRVASLPGGDGKRQLIIRSLSVGRIRSQQSSATLSLAIEHRLHGLASSAIHAEDPASPSRPAVYFRDDVEPYVRLALRV